MSSQSSNNIEPFIISTINKLSVFYATENDSIIIVNGDQGTIGHKVNTFMKDLKSSSKAGIKCIDERPLDEDYLKSQDLPDVDGYINIPGQTYGLIGAFKTSGFDMDNTIKLIEQAQIQLMVHTAKDDSSNHPAGKCGRRGLESTFRGKLYEAFAPKISGNMDSNYDEVDTWVQNEFKNGKMHQMVLKGVSHNPDSAVIFSASYNKVIDISGAGIDNFFNMDIGALYVRLANVEGIGPEKAKEITTTLIADTLVTTCILTAGQVFYKLAMPGSEGKPRCVLVKSDNQEENELIEELFSNALERIKQNSEVLAELTSEWQKHGAH